MKKFKIIIYVMHILVLVLITILGIKIHKNTYIDCTILDTLPDGKGRNAIVVLLGGQSNASGCSSDKYLKLNVTADKYAEYEAGYDNVYINYYASDNNISQSFVKCAIKQGDTREHFGPELGIAEKLNSEFPSELFFIIKCAWGGTNLYNQWLSPSSSGKTGILYKKFIKFVNSSLAYLKNKNYDVKIEAMCWMQGESDSFRLKDAMNYKNNLNNFIEDIRNEFQKYSSNDGIAFIDAYIADNPMYWVNYQIINESKKEIADLKQNNIVIDTIENGLTCGKEPYDNPDLAHYDSLSQIKLGNLFAESIVDFIDK